MPRYYNGALLFKDVIMPDIEQQKQFYNERWKGLKPLGSYKLQRTQYIMEVLSGIRREMEGELKLLDLGCGDGRLVPLWQSITAADAQGIELSPHAVQTAMEMFPTIKYTQGDATHTPYQDEEFDIVICQEVIEHIEDQAQLIKECSRILKKDGWLILTTPNRYYFDRRKGGNYSTQPIEKLLNKDELIDLLRSRFEITQYDTVIYAGGDYGVYKVFTNRYLMSAMRHAGLINQWKRTLLKKGLGLHMIATCRRK